MLGGDPEGGYPEQGIWVNAAGETMNDGNVFDDEDIRSEYAEHMDHYHDIQQQLFDALDEGDQISECVSNAVHRECDDENLSNTEEVADDLYEQATRAVYRGTNVSVISATIVLVNMAVIHGVSNSYVDELLKYLSKVLLPGSNMLPGSHYEAKKLIRKLGLNYNVIHACPDGCVLYHGDKQNLKECPNPGCGKSRFMQGSDVIPTRVIRHFPIIPRLLRMFRSPAIADLLRFHSDHPNMEPGVMKSVVDSPAWKHVDTNIDPSFGEEVRNLRFGLSLDGVNPFAHNTTSHSTWPVLLLIYNLPPFLVTKKFFIQLSILVSGKMSPTNENIDVFIQPIIEELQELWVGVSAQDFSKPPGTRRFTLRGILMWTISDYPAYGLISGLCTHGYKACTVCGPHTDGRVAKSENKLDAHKKAKGRKIVYGGSRRWTSRTHPYRRNLQFDGKVEFRATPVRMTAEQTIQCGKEREEYLANGGRKGADDDPVHEHGVKRRNALNDLPYWTVSIMFYRMCMPTVILSVSGESLKFANSTSVDAFEFVTCCYILQ